MEKKVKGASKYRQYRKVLKQVHIDNHIDFNRDLDRFLAKNANIKIEHIITHKPYHVTIIYSELIEIK